MNQNKITIKLIDYTKDDHPFGNSQGKDVFRSVSDFIDSKPLTKVFCISLDGIVATDASFPRESIISIVQKYHGERYFYLKDFVDQDLIDNWNYAAKAKKQPMVVWSKRTYILIGSELNQSNLILFNYIMNKQSVTTAKTASDLSISVPNASTKLKKLVSLGYIMRSEEIAETGGIEFIYHSIKQSG